MVVIVLLTTCSLFAVAALFSRDQVLADDVAASPSASASPSPNGDVTPTPTPTPTTTDTAIPTPTPTPTVDPAVLLDIKQYKKLALKVKKKAKLVRAELVKRREAFCKPAPARLKPCSAFDTWESRWRYYSRHLKSFRGWNKYYWQKMVTKPGKLYHPHSIGVARWKPLLRYCGLPLSLMSHALSVMWRESNGDSKAVNSSNHRGLYQFAVDWWRDKITGRIKWNPLNPYQNVLHFVRAVLGKPGWSPWAETA